jgi:tetratricopeptide (TPR) repeat protein
MRVRIFKVLLFASVLCMLNNAFGQTEETAYRDSLKFESTNSGYTSWNIGKYSYALSRYFEALEICTKTGDLKGVYNCFNNIGIINQKQLNYENAEKYYLQALNTADIIDDELGKSQVYINLVNLFMDKGDSALVFTDVKEFYGKSFDYYKKALPIKESAGDARGVFLCYNNMGNLVKKQGLYLNSFYDRD